MPLTFDNRWQAAKKEKKKRKSEADDGEPEKKKKKKDKKCATVQKHRAREPNCTHLRELGAHWCVNHAAR